MTLPICVICSITTSACFGNSDASPSISDEVPPDVPSDPETIEDEFMKVPRSWLAEFLPIDSAGPAGTPITDSEIVSALDSLGLVVEGVETFGVEPSSLDGIVVGEVVTIRPHPNADKIRLVDVRIADGAGPIDQIACGAWNFEVGDRVPVAMLGTTMPDGMKIEKRKLRGEFSNGMLCSGKELRVGEDHGGILILPPTTPLGVPIAAVVPTGTDTVYDIAIEANRPDAMSVLGVARDLAPRLGLTLDSSRRQLPAPAAPRSVHVRGTISAPDLCDRLTTTVIRSAAVVPSPDWVRHRLERAGMRGINNLVDASNLVMLELGIPSHAFDLDKLAGGGIDVRWAAGAERIVTLDGVDRELSTNGVIDGVIADGNGAAVGIAAIMGGLTSEVDDTTTSLLLEVAHWTPMAIARSSKKLGLRSEASARFERNSDADAIDAAIARFVEIVALTCPTVSVESYDDIRPAPPVPRVVDLRTARTNLLLGTSLNDTTIASLLEGIGFSVTSTGPGTASVTVPSWRPDCEAEVNLIEEVGRHHGYGNIVRVVPLSPHVGALSAMQKDRRAVRRIMMGLGAFEAWTPSLCSPSDLERSGLPAAAVALSNPMVAEETLLRPSLVPGLLRALKFNANHRNPAVRLFETGHTFAEPRPRQVTPYEREHLVAVFAADGDDARTAVAALHTLTNRLGVVAKAIDIATAADIAGMHPTRSARIIGAGTGFPIGAVGEIDPGVLEAWGIDRRVGVLRVDLENLCHLPRRSDHLAAIPAYPSSDIDLAFVVPDTVAAGAVRSALIEAGADLLESVHLFDVYRGQGVPEGSRSLAFRLRFVSAERTLTDGDVGTRRQACIDAVATLGAALRS
jgi:phenylalanyl-tRNA synthetase beta chain